jgi:hypothetical protein
VELRRSYPTFQGLMTRTMVSLGASKLDQINDGVF